MTVRMGCTIDLDDEYGDDCVLDIGRPQDCVYARKHGANARDYCGEWRPVTVYTGKVLAPTAPPDHREAMRLALDHLTRWERMEDSETAEDWLRVVTALRVALQEAAP